MPSAWAWERRGREMKRVPTDLTRVKSRILFSDIADVEVECTRCLTAHSNSTVLGDHLVLKCEERVAIFVKPRYLKMKREREREKKQTNEWMHSEKEGKKYRTLSRNTKKLIVFICHTAKDTGRQKKKNSSTTWLNGSSTINYTSELLLRKRKKHPLSSSFFRFIQELTFLLSVAFEWRGKRKEEEKRDWV